MALWQQYLLDLIMPPIVTAMWWLLSRGNATAIEGGKLSQRTSGWLRKGFVIVLLGTYLLMFGITTYLHFAK
jgi:hypothetical protein